MPPTESTRDGDASCCSLDTKNCVREDSYLRGFCDGDVVEVSVNNNTGVMTLEFPSFSPFLASFSVAVVSFMALVLVLVNSLSAF